jgi:hypothetical protein
MNPRDGRESAEGAWRCPVCGGYSGPSQRRAVEWLNGNGKPYKVLVCELCYRGSGAWSSRPSMREGGLVPRQMEKRV